jgi:hypothetical protein
MGQVNEKKITYVASPTLAQFHADGSFIRGVMGPPGSGKSVACCMEIMRRAAEQNVFDGQRRSRWVVVRNTYSQLRDTTIKTWKEWIPPDIAPISATAPFVCRLRRPLPDKTFLDLEVDFLALDTPDDIGRLRSYETSGVWINEASEINKSLLDWLTLRVGRWPPPKSGGNKWRGIIMDTNPTNTRHWWYRMAEVEKPKGWRFWRQPPALIRTKEGQYVPNVGQVPGIPKAENIENIDEGFNYYLRAVAGKDPEWIRVNILGEYGSVFDGKPVYEDIYSDSRHMSKTPLGLYKGLPLYLSWDWGLTPACLFGQIAPNGQIRILREFQGENTALREFVNTVVKPALAGEFADMSIISTGDPAGEQRSQVDEATPIGELGRLGIPTRPARTNDFLMRRQSVVSSLSRMIGDHPGFIIDPSCKLLREGFLGGYQFARVRVTGTERYHDVPLKNIYSHLHDCCQYFCMCTDTSYTMVEELPPIAASVPAWG